MIYAPAYCDATAICLVLALICCRKNPPPTPPLSVVSAWMIFSIDSFVHPCGQICTCNQSPVDTGLITVLIWHPAACRVLARTQKGNHRGGFSELKMSLHPCCCTSTTHLQNSTAASVTKRRTAVCWDGFKVKRQVIFARHTDDRAKAKHRPEWFIADSSSLLCHAGRYRCLHNPPACLLRSVMATVFTRRHARAVSRCLPITSGVNLVRLSQWGHPRPELPSPLPSPLAQDISSPHALSLYFTVLFSNRSSVTVLDIYPQQLPLKTFLCMSYLYKSRGEKEEVQAE